MGGGQKKIFLVKKKIIAEFYSIIFKRHHQVTCFNWFHIKNRNQRTHVVTWWCHWTQKNRYQENLHIIQGPELKRIQGGVVGRNHKNICFCNSLQAPQKIILSSLVPFARHQRNRHGWRHCTKHMAHHFGRSIVGRMVRFRFAGNYPLAPTRLAG